MTRKLEDTVWQDSVMQEMDKKPKPEWLERINQLFKDGNVLALSKVLLTCKGVSVIDGGLILPPVDQNKENLKANYVCLCLYSHSDGQLAIGFNMATKQSLVNDLTKFIEEKKWEKTPTLKKIFRLFLNDDIKGLLGYLMSRNNAKLTLDGFLLPEIGSNGENIEIYMAHQLLFFLPGAKYFISNLLLEKLMKKSGVKLEVDMVVYAFGRLERKRAWVPTK